MPESYCVLATLVVTQEPEEPEEAGLEIEMAIPRKNIKDFCGKPMIAWSIEAALQSGCFASVIVSTDDAEIAEVARQWGAQVPFLRPAALAGMSLTRGCPVFC